MNVLVTGANRGIGLALTRNWLAKGATVHATARDLAKATELRALADASSGALTLVPLDVDDASQVDALGAAVRGTKLDVLVNNAGISGKHASKLVDVDFDDIARVFATNALGPLRVTRALMPALAPGAKVINISSLMGSIEDNGSGGAYGYRMSKVALNMAGKNLAHELSGRKVVVITMHPGWVQTDMGGMSAPLSPDTSAAGIIAMSERATVEHTGRFFNYDGRQLPW